jgi:hypothetical protein
MRLRHILIFSAIAISFVSCFSDENTAPKPKTYMCLDVPKPSYKTFSESYLPFTFSYPDYGVIEKTQGQGTSHNWFNINFASYGCKLYVSYMPMNSVKMMDTLVNDCYTFLQRHQDVANGLLERVYSSPKTKVYGTVFEIKGEGVTSTYQFYVTDSVHNFLRGALYFDYKANNDSIAPIIQRLKTDLDFMISSLRWK